jgi:hypothetical protein
MLVLSNSTIAKKHIEEKGKLRMAKTKNLTVASLKKDAKPLDKMYSVTINDYSLKIYETFSPTKLGAVVNEFMDDFQTMGGGKEIMNVFTPYLYLMLIKHVTSLDVPNDIEGKIETIELLTDLGIFADILEAMPQSELEKFADKIKEVSNSINANMDVLEDEISEYEFENEEVEKLLE